MVIIEDTIDYADEAENIEYICGIDSVTFLKNTFAIFIPLHHAITSGITAWGKVLASFKLARGELKSPNWP